jgi:heavy metal translocating P-type ATPase
VSTLSIFKYRLGYLAYVLVAAFLFLLTLSNQTPHFFIFIPFVLAFIPICIDAIKDIFERKITTELFLILATATAFAANEKQAITVVLLIMLIAKYFEGFIEEKTGKAIESLINLIPTKVTVKIGNQEQVIALEDVQQGMTVIIKTGEQIPIDGVILDGEASINESFLTGESIPQEKSKSDQVFAGTFVEAGAIIILAQKVGESTNFGKISKLLEQAEQEKAKIITVSNRAALIIVQVLVVFIGLVWFFTRDLKLVSTLLVFGSPIELTLITPLAILAGTAAAFRYGILIKGSISLERFSSVDTLIFDKTGTLTIGEPQVVKVEALHDSYTTHDILMLAAMMEKRSGHILAKAILKKAHEEKIEVPEPQSYESITGHGIDATYNNQKYLLGSRHFIEAPEHGNVPIPESLSSEQADLPYSIFYLSCGPILCGKIYLADTIRPDARETINLLRSSGIKEVILLSGDRHEVAQHVAAQLGIDKAYGEIAPDEKLTVIKDLQKAGHRVAMIGDGINDAPALKQADVGIAMGAMGMEPAIQAAGIVLMSNRLEDIVFIHALSQKIMRLIKQNIFFGFMLIHLLGIMLALFNLVNPIQAALFHAVSDILILVNSARLIRFKYNK